MNRVGLYLFAGDIHGTHVTPTLSCDHGLKSAKFRYQFHFQEVNARQGERSTYPVRVEPALLTLR